MAEIYRSAKIILQNNSMENLAITGYAAIKGIWAQEPAEGDVVEANGTAVWGTGSVTPNAGTAGTITMITSKGYITLTWEVPWMGYTSETIHMPEGYYCMVDTYDEQPNYPVLRFTLWGAEVASAHQLFISPRNEVAEERLPVALVAADVSITESVKKK